MPRGQTMEPDGDLTFAHQGSSQGSKWSRRMGAKLEWGAWLKLRGSARADNCQSQRMRTSHHRRGRAALGRWDYLCMYWPGWMGSPFCFWPQLPTVSTALADRGANASGCVLTHHHSH